MKNVLGKIFNEAGYDEYKNDTDTYFLRTDGIENYIVSEYSKEDFDNFFESKQTDNIIKVFEEWKLENEDVKNNTSMLICVEINELDENKYNYKNQIMIIEEDEYYFRKYVLIYTAKSIENLSVENNVCKEIRRVISDDKRFKDYEKEAYKDDEFFVAIELMIKLPFLKLDMKQQTFKSLDKKIESKLKEDISAECMEGLEKLLLEFKDPTYLEDLKKSFVNENTEERLEKFFSMFEVN